MMGQYIVVRNGCVISIDPGIGVLHNACSLLSDANERVTREVNIRGGYLLPLEEALSKIELISRT